MGVGVDIASDLFLNVAIPISIPTPAPMKAAVVVAVRGGGRIDIAITGGLS